MQMLRHRAQESLDAIQQGLQEDCPKYSFVFTRALEQIDPIFFSPVYEGFFWHCASSIPNWLPRVIAACATTEGNGAHGLLDIWRRVDFYEAAEDGLLRHAKDEAGHARLFVQLARLLYPSNYGEGYIDDLSASLQPVTPDLLGKSEEQMDARMLLDYLMQLNIVEMRTRIHLHFLAPAYFNTAPAAVAGKVERILNGLNADETRHMCYTAQLIEQILDDGELERAAGIYACRLGDYHKHSLDHCNSAVNDYGQGSFPQLFAH